MGTSQSRQADGPPSARAPAVGAVAGEASRPRLFPTSLSPRPCTALETRDARGGRGSHRGDARRGRNGSRGGSGGRASASSRSTWRTKGRPHSVGVETDNHQAGEGARVPTPTARDTDAALLCKPLGADGLRISWLDGDVRDGGQRSGLESVDRLASRASQPLRTAEMASAVVCSSCSYERRCVQCSYVLVDDKCDDCAAPIHSWCMSECPCGLFLCARCHLRHDYELGHS